MTQGDRELIERLMDVLSSDHKRGCDGRTYTCNCGYDDQVEQIADQATDRLQALSAENERLESALRIAIWSDPRARGLSQDDAIAEVKTKIASLKGANNG